MTDRFIRIIHNNISYDFNIAYSFTPEYGHMGFQNGGEIKHHSTIMFLQDISVNKIRNFKGNFTLKRYTYDEVVFVIKNCSVESINGKSVRFVHNKFEKIKIPELSEDELLNI
jgi:hypothetical protein